MNCQDVRNQLDAYLDGELDPTSRASVDQHVANCAPCANELRTLRQLSASFASFRVELPDGLMDRVHDAVERARDTGILRIARAMSAVAASIVLAGTFYLTYATSQSAPQASTGTSYAASWERAAAGADLAGDAQTAGATSGNTGDVQLAELILSDLSKGQR